MIAVVDYGLGNLKSVKSALDRLGIEATVTSEAAAILAADGVIFPGVGAFSKAMDNLRELRILDAVRGAATSGKPFLGICLGLQLLFTESSEHGHHDGLAILPGKVVRFDAGPKKDSRSLFLRRKSKGQQHLELGKRLQESFSGAGGLKVPHMGWNQVRQERPSPLFGGIPDQSFFYFAHSYYAQPDDPAVAIGSTDYGVRFASAVQRGNVFATQFHPEKSGPTGLGMLENFCRLCRR